MTRQNVNKRLYDMNFSVIINKDTNNEKKYKYEIP